MRGGSQRMADKIQKTMMDGGQHRAADVEPACHVLEDGSQVANDDIRTVDEEPPATSCIDVVTRQLTRRCVSCSRTKKRSFRNRS